MTGNRELCHCGRPLHYLNPMAEASVRRLIATLGEFVKVETADGVFRVPRHYVALHGLRADEVADLGFERAG